MYKKVAVKDGKLAGVILVGDTSDSHRYMEWLRTDADIGDKRGQLLFPPPSADAGLDVAEMSDSATVCGCVGVTKGAIIAAIHDRGVNTMSQLKECTRASTGCGSCTSLCQDLLRAVAPEFEDEKKKVICACVPFAEDRLREILRSQKLKSVQDVLEIYGNGIGCEICKPALSYMLDMLWCGDHDEDRSARFINDRVHANIQKDGTFSVVPRIRGGVTSPDELRRIADVADKYQVPMVKITGSQRIDLLGIKKADLPKVWADLGMPSGQAYTKGVRMVKTCVGTEFCRFGTQDSTAAGIEMERRFEQLYTPHKVKMAAVGCPRNCAEATVKDIGLIGIEGGWQVVVGGAAGKSVRKADLLTTVETTEQALEASELFFQVLPRERELSRADLRLRRASRHREGAQGNGLRAGRRPRRTARSVSEVEGAGARCMAGRTGAASSDAVRPRRGARMSDDRGGRLQAALTWTRVTACDNIPPREGRAVSLAGREIAIFNLGDRFLAVDNQCPHRAGPLADGIVRYVGRVSAAHVEDQPRGRPRGAALGRGRSRRDGLSDPCRARGRRRRRACLADAARRRRGGGRQPGLEHSRLSYQGTITTRTSHRPPLSTRRWVCIFELRWSRRVNPL